MIRVDQLPLWDVLRHKANDEQRETIRELIVGAADILDRIVETFPTYTLHSSVHAENVAHLMADLLGAWIDKLSALEASLLLLSAFYHDIGMAFSDAERNSLSEDPEWPAFLDKHPEAYVAMKSNAEISPEIAEWYCRWRHADRVFLFLNRLPAAKLLWVKISIREELGELCRSHNQDIGSIQLNHQLRIDFMASADLRFCALLLRLADILDFDRSRSPETVYEYLSLSRRDTPRTSASDVEWRKHLCAEGFVFPSERSSGFTLDFVAGPEEPAVEHDVRQFLNVIESEFVSCQSLLETCHPRWHKLPLPRHINRHNIHSNGYRFGEYRFTLDQKQVLDLLMGENLYEDPYVFVRELLQNAIDASRHRQYSQPERGTRLSQPKHISLWEWRDEEHRRWIRVDDFGMGMDEEIVRNHLLRVGSSSYRTAKFRAEILHAQEQGAPGFMPISRFGVGLLSCFIAADRIEISTLRQGTPSLPLRLSLRGIHGFFTLQTPPLPPAPMPHPHQGELEYRKEPGTSIALRLDPSRDHFELGHILNRYVLCPPIGVQFNGDRVGLGIYLLDQPWCQRTSFILEAQRLDPGHDPGNGSHLSIDFFPLDLSRHSATHELKGQLVLVARKFLGELASLEKSLQTDWTVDLPKLEIGLKVISPAPVGRSHAGWFCRIEKNRLLDILNKNAVDFFGNRSGRGVGLLLAHNGMAVPVEYADPDRRNIDMTIYVRKDRILCLAGIISLSDSLRPDVLVSRDRLKNMPWRLHSAAGLALRRALLEWQNELEFPERLCPFGDLGYVPTLKELIEDDLLSVDGPWAAERIIKTAEGMMTVPDLRERLKGGPIEILPLLDYAFRFTCDDVTSHCAAALIQQSFTVRFNPSSSKVLAFPGPAITLLPGHGYFPPLTFIPFEGSQELGAEEGFLNQNHPFSQWLLISAPLLDKKFPALFDEFRCCLLKEDWPAEDSLDRLEELLHRARQLEQGLRPPGDLLVRRSNTTRWRP